MFKTSNHGLAAAFMMNGHQPVRAFRDSERDKPALEFEKTSALMAVFDAWKDRKLVGVLPDFNDAMFEVRNKLREV